MYNKIVIRLKAIKTKKIPFIIYFPTLQIMALKLYTF